MPYADGESVMTPDNIISANPLDNYLYGGAGANDIDGLCGNDLIAVGVYDSDAKTFTLGEFSQNDTVAGGNDIDTLKFDGVSDTFALANVTGIEAIQLGTQAVNIASTPDAMVDAGATLTLDGALSSGITFWAYNDTDSKFYMVGGSGGDYLKGAALADTLFGGLGDDCLSGQGGDDTLSGVGGGADTITGGSGNDGIFMGDQFGTDDDVDGGSGDDTLYFTDDGTGTDDLQRVHFVEHVVLGDAATAINYTNSGADSGSTIQIDATALTGGNALNLTGYTNMVFDIESSSGDDSITVGNDADTIDGEAGDDTIIANGGNDYIDGGAGADVMEGGGGDDTLSQR